MLKNLYNCRSMKYAEGTLNNAIKYIESLNLGLSDSKGQDIKVHFSSSYPCKVILLSVLLAKIMVADMWWDLWKP